MNLADTILLLTRPEPDALRFLEEIRAKLGSFRQEVVSPIMRVEPLAVSLDTDPDRVFVFTSANAVRAMPHATVVDRPAWCVGEATASEARAAGIQVAGVAADIAGLTQLLLKVRPRGNILHAAGRHRRGALADTLLANGLTAATVEVYDQVAQVLSPEARHALYQQTSILAPLFSPRSAALLSAQAAERRASVHVVTISPAALDAWSPKEGEKALIAPAPHAQSMISTIGSLFDAAGFA